MELKSVPDFFSGDGCCAGLHSTLGMEFVSTPDPDSIMARMVVDERHAQHRGYMNGGASLALAETLAGLGSITLCPDSVCFGMNISASHVHPVAVGDTVTAVATIVHKGRHTHLWQVEIRDGNGVLTSRASVTNYISDKQ